MYIKTLLKFFLLFLFDVIKTNPAKIIFLVICLFSFSKAGTYADVKESYTIVDSLKVKEHNGINHLYITAALDNNKLKYDLLSSTTPLKIVNGKYEYMAYSDVNLGFWVAFWISLAFLVIAFFMGLGDDDISWEIPKCWQGSFASMIICEEENGKFYYMCLGRLLIVRDQVYNTSYRSMYHDFNIRGFRDLNLYPKFQTKQNKRQSKLDKLGI